MPMYDYKCLTCNYVQEEFIMNVEDRKTVKIRCSNCGNSGMILQMSGPRTKLRGSGFHDTDYGKYGPKVR